MNTRPHIITNMTFWQSAVWMEHTDSIYALDPQRGDPDFVSPWREAWRLFRRRKDYDVVMTMGIRESMTYGTLCLITGAPSKQIMTEVFIDHPQPHRWLWRMKTHFYGLIVRRAIGMIANSSEEIKTIAARYNLPESRLHFIRLNATIEPEETTEAQPPFILSAGRTLRDYDLVLRAAQALPSYPFEIICGEGDLRDVSLPDHLTLLREVDRSAYLERLRQCALVVLPLLPTERATGQVVMLEAMALGKPVITTRSPGTIDYLDDGKNGILIECGDADTLIHQCRTLMENPALRQQLGSAARDYISQHHGHDRHARDRLACIADFLEATPTTTPAQK